MLGKLRNKLFSKNTEITSLFHLMKEIGCTSEILGNNFEGTFNFKFDNKLLKWLFKDSEVKFVIRQKPMAYSQLSLLLDELNRYYKEKNKVNKRNGR